MATAHLGAAAAHVLGPAERHALLAALRAARHHPQTSPTSPLPTAPLPTSPLPTSPSPTLPASAPSTDGSQSTVKLKLPYNFQDWGVVSLWNNTGGSVTFQVSASTFNNGQFYTFSLNSGQNMAFYAPVVSGFAPVFQVRFNSSQSDAIPIPEDNIVFESTSYVPSGTAGRPYAIGLGVNGYFTSPI
jgi:hypothetical protein